MAVEPRADSGTARASARGAEGAQHSVLIVDDDPSIRKLVAVSLRRAGYDVTQATNGREALDAIAAATPDLISRRGDADVIVGVRDQGLGIPPEALETIFERYSRIESGATRFIQGTGLGLPIVRQIVEMHGGRVWAESAVGEGSTFHVTLPLAGPPERD